MIFGVLLDDYTASNVLLSFEQSYWLASIETSVVNGVALGFGLFDVWSGGLVRAFETRLSDDFFVYGEHATKAVRPVVEIYSTVSMTYSNGTLTLN